MLSYEEMQYFVAFAKTGTLSEVAEQFHISQPTITRAMKKVEAEFNVPLFDRTKNSIRLSDNGTLAAEEVTPILKRTDEMIGKVRAYDRANRTISIGSGAAVSLSDLVRRLAEAYPEKPISTELKKPPELLDSKEYLSADHFALCAGQHRIFLGQNRRGASDVSTAEEAPIRGAQIAVSRTDGRRKYTALFGDRLLVGHCEKQNAPFTVSGTK